MTVDILYFTMAAANAVTAFAIWKIASDLRQQQKDIAHVESNLTETMRMNTRASLENHMITLGMINQLIERIEKLEKINDQ